MRSMLTAPRLVMVTTLCLVGASLLWASGSGEQTLQTTPHRPEHVDSDTPSDTAADAPADTTPSAAGVPAVIEVIEGEHFMHRLKVMPLIRVKNHPQMAVWCETEEGEFISTLFITERIGTESWHGAPGDPTPAEEIRRKESLPVWAHRHGTVYGDGLRLPTEDEPMPDGVTAATPTSSFTVRTELPAGHERLRIYLEVNNSTDFNDHYTEDAPEGSPTYSGGPWGSGQPALIYGGVVDLTATGATAERVDLELLGHASPDGSTGRIYEDFHGVTTALDIVEGASIRLEEP